MVLARCVFLVLLTLPLAVPAAAQESASVVELTFGYAGFVDDATQHFSVLGGGFRHYVTPRLSLGPEFVMMFGGDSLRDRVVMLTGNVVYDLVPPARRATPFVVGGLGGFWVRESFPSGPFWAADPAFSAGGGVRARVSDRVAVTAEYRLGWELHQRITGTVTFDLR